MQLFCIFARLSAHFGEFQHDLKEERYMILPLSTYVQASYCHVQDDCKMETIDCGCGAVSTRQPVIQRRNGKAVSEYNSDVMDEGAIITDETDEERTCLLGGGAGRSSDRSSYRGIERAKGVE